MFIMDPFIIPIKTLLFLIQTLATSIVSDTLTSPNHHHHHTPTHSDISIVPLPSCAPPLLSKWSVAGMSDEPVFGLTTGTGC